MKTLHTFAHTERLYLPVIRAILLGTVIANLACGDETVTRGWRESFDATSRGWMLSTWGVDRNQRWAVGGSPDDGVMMQLQSDGWGPVSLPNGTPLLNWVFGFSASEVWAVGNEGVILFYDGQTWTNQLTPTGVPLWGIWGAASDDMWAVGGSGLTDSQATLLHYDGSAWEEVAFPPLTRPNVFAFFKVWGSAADHVVVVGQRGALMVYDGNTWTEELVGTSEDLISVWGSGQNNIVVVGGRANGVVVRYDGLTWESRSVAPIPGLNGVWVSPNGYTVVNGISATMGVLTGFDIELEQTPGLLDYHAAFGTADGILTAVGGNFANSQGPYEGMAFEREWP